jgi:hypothetical protein
MTDEKRAERTATYLVQCAGRPDFQLRIPADWRLTFGAVNPGAPPHGRDLHCLRVWEGAESKKQLRAVFCDVRGFRDLSLEFARKVEVETGNSTWVRDDAGNYESSEKRQLEARWEEDERSPF